MPLHVEILYNEYDFVGAFAVACSLLALVTLREVVWSGALTAKTVVEWRLRRD